MCSSVENADKLSKCQTCFFSTENQVDHIFIATVFIEVLHLDYTTLVHINILYGVNIHGQFLKDLLAIKRQLITFLLK